MQFNSIEFLFVFLPLFLAAYYLLPRVWHVLTAAVGSLVFYSLASCGKLWWMGLLLVLTVLVFGAAQVIGRKKSGILLTVSLLCLTALLTVCKVYDGGRHLPAGMSFYIFQMAAYLIDVYRRRCPAQTRILPFVTQITLFPKLLSGPLMYPRRMQLECKYAKPSRANLRGGMQYLILGLCFKVLLANRVGGLWAEAGTVGYAYLSVPYAWLAVVSYSMRLYFDFYGYSLMAIGVGRMLGWELPRNFDAPYASQSVSEFYRRWHMTLGAWFREYLYIPLGGNRKGTARTILNLAIVWLFTGLWHGIGGNYLIWAGFLFLLIVNERLWLGKLLKRAGPVSHLYVIGVILLSWVPFAVGDFDQMVMLLGRMFGLIGKTVNPLDFLVKLESYGPMLLVGAVLATPWPRKIWEKLRNTFLADLTVTVLFWICVYFIATAAQDPFLYFSF